MGARVRQNEMELVGIGSEQGHTRETFAIAFLLHIVTKASFYPIISIFDRQMILIKYGLDYSFYLTKWLILQKKIASPMF